MRTIEERLVEILEAMVRTNTYEELRFVVNRKIQRLLEDFRAEGIAGRVIREKEVS